MAPASGNGERRVLAREDRQSVITVRRACREAVQHGAHERLIPILMTAMAAGLALIPLALGGGNSGSEIQTPMAIVILCGLTTSTILNMVVVPTMYLRYGRPQ